MSKTVLIIGGTRGIGKALVSKCLSLGYTVISTGSNDRTVDAAKLSSPSVRWICCDLSDKASIKQLAEVINGEPLDMVIHNAGVQQARDLFDPAHDDLSVAVETQINFNAPIELTQLLFRNVESVKGTWVYITSGLAIAPKQSSPIYCANKAGLRAFCKSFNGQIKLKGSEIKVCEAILPLVDTDMIRGRGRGKISAEQAANEIMQGKQTLAKRVMDWITKNGRKPQAVYILAGISIGDFFVPALPTQTSVMLLAWLQPRKAWVITLMFAFAAAVGASILCFLSILLDNYLQSVIPTKQSSHYQNWEKLKGYISQYGLYALAAMSLLPTPPRTMVILSLLSGISGYLVVATIFLGKLIWFGGVVFTVSRSPKWLIKLPWIGRKIAQSISQKQSLLHQATTSFNADK